jgi:hypothetical protein
MEIMRRQGDGEVLRVWTSTSRVWRSSPRAEKWSLMDQGLLRVEAAFEAGIVDVVVVGRVQ